LDTAKYHFVDFFIYTFLAQTIGLKEDKNNQAFGWLKKAADKGNAEAIFTLANLYAKRSFGITDDLSVAKAIELYTLAADKGHKLARFNLGNRCRTGNGVAIDFRKCIELFEQSAIQGYNGANFNLCCLYAQGSQDDKETVPVNHVLRFKWAMMAAKRGGSDALEAQRVCHVDCMMIVAEAYLSGQGVTKNYTHSFEWYLKAAKGNSRQAQYNVAMMLKDGVGVEANHRYAAFWYRRWLCYDLNL
jgi:hypothetical protein